MRPFRSLPLCAAALCLVAGAALQAQPRLRVFKTDENGSRTVLKLPVHPFRVLDADGPLKWIIDAYLGYDFRYPNLSVLAGDQNRILRINHRGEVQVFAAADPAKRETYFTPSGIAIRPAQEGLEWLAAVADEDPHVVWGFDAKGKCSLLAGSLDQAGLQDGDCGHARFDRPVALTFWSDGSLLVADRGNGVIRNLKNRVVLTTCGAPHRLLRAAGKPLPGLRDGNAAIFGDLGGKEI